MFGDRGLSLLPKTYTQRQGDKSSLSFSYHLINYSQKAEGIGARHAGNDQPEALLKLDE
jgi:hypothetical protein